jgi:TPP-dependent pyruvate/acetoin dehydrogenase alpha subunit
MDGMTNDPMAYIAAGEVASKVESDPVPRFREWLIAQGHATEDELTTIDAECAGRSS